MYLIKSVCALKTENKGWSDRRALQLADLGLILEASHMIPPSLQGVMTEYIPRSNLSVSKNAQKNKSNKKQRKICPSPCPNHGIRIQRTGLWVFSWADRVQGQTLMLEMVVSWPHGSWSVFSLLTFPLCQSVQEAI